MVALIPRADSDNITIPYSKTSLEQTNWIGWVCTIKMFRLHNLLGFLQLNRKNIMKMIHKFYRR